MLIKAQRKNILHGDGAGSVGIAKCFCHNDTIFFIWQF